MKSQPAPGSKTRPTTTPLRVLTLLGLVAVLLFSAPPPLAASSPQGAVERLNAVVAQARDRADGAVPALAGRQFATELQDIFDYWLMAKAAVGPIWKRLDRSERDALVKAFTGFNIAVYAARFAAMHGDDFVVTGIEQGRRGTVVVRTQARRADGTIAHQAYLTRAHKGRWLVVDVWLEGKFSDLAATRSEYLSVIKYQGFERLLQLLREKTQALRDS